MTTMTHVSLFVEDDTDEPEWRQVTCDERDGLYWTGFDALPVPIASSTDPDRYVFTEWGHPATHEPVLRDHRWPDGSHPCKHEVPVVRRDLR